MCRDLCFEGIYQKFADANRGFRLWGQLLFCHIVLRLWSIAYGAILTIWYCHYFCKNASKNFESYLINGIDSLYKFIFAEKWSKFSEKQVGWRYAPCNELLWDSLSEILSDNFIKILSTVKISGKNQIIRKNLQHR